MEKQIAEDEGERSFRQRIADTRNWDKVIILIAAVLSFCFAAFLFKPSIGPSITKIFEEVTAKQEAEAKRLAAPPITPGRVDMILYPSKPAPAKAAPARN